MAAAPRARAAILRGGAGERRRRLSGIRAVRGVGAVPGLRFGSRRVARGCGLGSLEVPLAVARYYDMDLLAVFLAVPGLRFGSLPGARAVPGLRFGLPWGRQGSPQLGVQHPVMARWCDSL